MNNIAIKEIKSQGLLRAYEVTVSGTYIESVFEEELKKKAANTSIPGFRPGKVNPEVVRQRRGKEILRDVLEDLLDETAQNVISEYKLTPSTQPHFHPAEAYEKGKDFKYMLHVEILPEIEPLDFSSITIPFCLP